MSSPLKDKNAQTLELAWQKLKQKEDSRLTCSTGAELLAGGGLKLSFFNLPYIIDREKKQVLNERGEPVSSSRAILILHYLLSAKEAPLSWEMVGYRELPGGMTYAQVFEQRAEAPLSRAFDKIPQSFAAACRKLGGEKLEFAPWAFRLFPFKGLPVEIILWEADEEFSGSCKILFDLNSLSILSLEELAVLGEQIAKELICKKDA